MTLLAHPNCCFVIDHAIPLNPLPAPYLFWVLVPALQNLSWNRLTWGEHGRMQLLVHLTSLYKRRPFWSMHCGSHERGCWHFLLCRGKGHLCRLSYIQAQINYCDYCLFTKDMDTISNLLSTSGFVVLAKVISRTLQTSKHTAFRLFTLYKHYL